MTRPLPKNALLPLILLIPAVAIGCGGGSTAPTEPARPVTPTASGLSATTTNAMHLAIEDEYKARATYDAVMARFGRVRPFVNIRNAEDKHVQALRNLFNRYGVSVPADPWPGTIDAPATLTEACQLGVVAELENIAMYDELLSDVTEPDVINVFNRLRSASLNNHLPAFRRCS